VARFVAEGHRHLQKISTKIAASLQFLAHGSGVFQVDQFKRKVMCNQQLGCKSAVALQLCGTQTAG
jgi:hypothetical protein